MRASEIEVGGTYTNGRWNRRVIGDADSRNPRQKDDEQVQFVEVLTDGTEMGPFTITRAGLAKWAKGRAEIAASPRTEVAALMDAMEAAWGVIANAHGGDWSLAGPTWRAAAERWRDEHWHPALRRNAPTATQADAEARG